MGHRTIARVADAAVYAALFLLPWQTRLIYRDLSIGDGTWEYGRLSVYAVELVLLAAVTLRGRLRIPYRLLPFLGPVSLLVGVLLMSVALSRNVTVALGALPHFAAAMTLFLAVIDERTDARRAALAFVAGLIVPALLAWYQVVTGVSPASSWLGLAAHDAVTLGQSVVETASGRLLRGYGTFPHPNVLGGYLAAGLVVIGWLAREARGAGSRLLLCAPASLVASALVVTFSRSAWLGASVGFASLAVGMIATRRALPHRVLPFLSFALVAILLSLVAFRSAAFARFQPGTRLEAKSIEERLGSYGTFDDVARTNVVTGVGPGNYTLALATLYPGRPAYAYQPVHNAPLLAFGEVGLILLLPFVRFASPLYRLLRERAGTAGGLFAVALLAALVPVALLDHYLWSLWPGLALSAFVVGFSLKSAS